MNAKNRIERLETQPRTRPSSSTVATGYIDTAVDADRVTYFENGVTRTATLGEFRRLHPDARVIAGDGIRPLGL